MSKSLPFVTYRNMEENRNVIKNRKWHRGKRTGEVFALFVRKMHVLYIDDYT